MGVLHEMRDEHDAAYREYKAALKADRRYEPARQNLLWHGDHYDLAAATCFRPGDL